MGETIGPLNPTELRSHASSGRIAIDTNVRKGVEGQWVPAGRIKGLFDAQVTTSPPPLPNASSACSVIEPIQATAVPTGPVYTMTGVQDLLEVFDDHVSISPKGIMGFLNKGLKGTKEIPFTSIVAVQFKEAGSFFSGFLQFSIPGGNESKGGILAATRDENTFMFAHAKNNALANEIKTYIDTAVRKTRSPQVPTALSSLGDELQKLAALKASGVLSDDEFQVAKRKLIN
jgi:hypothetical protein